MIDASATRAASGVRSSWDTSATNRRFWSWAASSRRIVSASASAIVLNRSAQVPNSSCDVTGTRAARSPRSIRSAIRPASSTGARTPLTTNRTAASASHEQEDRAQDQGQAQLADGVLQPAHVVDEVERRPAFGRPARHDERRHPGDVRPGVGKLALGDEIAHLRREAIQQPVEVDQSTGTAARPAPGRPRSPRPVVGTYRQGRCDRCPRASAGRAVAARARSPRGRNPPGLPRHPGSGRGAAHRRTAPPRRRGRSPRGPPARTTTPSGVPAPHPTTACCRRPTERPCSRRPGRSGSARVPRDRPRSWSAVAPPRRRRAANRRGSHSPRSDRGGCRGP